MDDIAAQKHHLYSSPVFHALIEAIAGTGNQISGRQYAACAGIEYYRIPILAGRQLPFIVQSEYFCRVCAHSLYHLIHCEPVCLYAAGIHNWQYCLHSRNARSGVKAGASFLLDIFCKCTVI